jgi:tetratricopeptide (TPR) repeat protein
MSANMSSSTWAKWSLAALASVLLSPASVLAQENPARRSTAQPPAALPDVPGARASENLRRGTANRVANDRERLALVEALIRESSGEPAALKQAETELSPLLARQNQSSEALMLAGRLATLSQQPALAALHYRAVLAASPNNSSAYLGLGNALTALNDVAGADAAFARYKELIGLKPRQ